MTSEPAQRYQARGVSSNKSEVKAAVAALDKGLFPGAFCRIVRDLAMDDRYCTILHSDDVGTKTALAYIAWKEGSGTGVWRDIAQDSLVMNLDDCACVGALGPFLVVNTIARNAKLIDGEVAEAIIHGYKALTDHLHSYGIECHLVGGETSDCGDVVRTLFVESTVSCRMQREHVIDASNIEPGDSLVSFASAGQALWEGKPTSGIGSNGLTSARHEALHAEHRKTYPETYSPEVDRHLVYCGRHTLGDPLPGDSRFTVGTALLSPTRTYAPMLRRLFDRVPQSQIHGLVHCTGGGQTKILNFGRVRSGAGNRYIKNALLPVPPVFQFLQEQTGQAWREMYQVFNMGQLLEAAVAPEIAQECIDVARSCGIDATISGHVERASSERNELVIVGMGGEHFFNA